MDYVPIGLGKLVYPKNDEQMTSRSQGDECMKYLNAAPRVIGFLYKGHDDATILRNIKTAQSSPFQILTHML